MTESCYSSRLDASLWPDTLLFETLSTIEVVRGFETMLSDLLMVQRLSYVDSEKREGV